MSIKIVSVVIFGGKVVLMNLFEKISAPVQMDVDEPLSKALGKIERKDECVVVTKDGKYVGILDDRSIEKVSSDPSTTKLGGIFERAPLIDTGSSLLEVCRSFFTGPYKSLPVREGENVVGVLKRKDVIEALIEAGALSGRVSEYMTSPIVTVDENATIAQARTKMRERGVRRIIVFGNGKLKGMLSIYDIRTRTSRSKEHAPFVKEKHSTEDALVSSLMVAGENVVTIAPDALLGDAAHKMTDAKVGSLVVMDKDRPIGLLSARDIFESIMFQDKTPIELSGLGYEERMMVDEIRGEVEREVEKIAKSVQLDYLALHFKRYGNKYSIHGRLKTSKCGIISVSNYGFDLQGTVHGLMGEMKKIALEKMKVNPMHGQTRGPFRGE